VGGGGVVGGQVMLRGKIGAVGVIIIVIVIIIGISSSPFVGRFYSIKFASFCVLTRIGDTDFGGYCNAQRLGGGEGDVGRVTDLILTSLHSILTHFYTILGKKSKATPFSAKATRQHPIPKDTEEFCSTKFSQATIPRISQKIKTHK